MRNYFLIALLLLGRVISAQNDKPSTNSDKLNEAFKIQENNCTQLEQLLLKNTAASRANKPKDYNSQNNDFYKELIGLYTNFKAAHKSFWIADLSSEQLTSIEVFYKAKLAKLDSLYGLRDKSLRVGILTDNPENILKSGQINPGPDESYSEPTHENCKTANKKPEESCVSFLFRRAVGRQYNVPEFRFSEEGITTALMVQFVITKNGELVLTGIPKSSKYFEFEMEALLAIEKFAKNNKFTPAVSNGKLVNVQYTCPINIATAGI